MWVSNMAACAWEGDPLIRTRARQLGQLTTWPSLNVVGIPSKKACAMNVRALELLALWWAPQTDGKTAVTPIAVVRSEADFKKTTNITNVGCMNTWEEHQLSVMGSQTVLSKLR